MCIFCKIVNKEIESNIVYEDSKTIVITDINPISNGHVLVIPKNHSKDICEIEIDDMNSINTIVSKVSKVLKNELECSGIHVITNVGSTQEIPHTHFHIIPVYESSPLAFSHLGNKDEIVEISNRIKTALM